MNTIDAIYDGNTIRFTEPIPFKGKYEVNDAVCDQIGHCD